MAETNVEEKYIDQTKNGYIPDNAELKCYILCLIEKSHSIDDNGTIDFSHMLHMFSPDYKESMINGMEKCATKCNLTSDAILFFELY